MIACCNYNSDKGRKIQILRKTDILPVHFEKTICHANSTLNGCLALRKMVFSYMYAINFNDLFYHTLL